MYVHKYVCIYACMNDSLLMKSVCSSTTVCVYVCVCARARVHAGLHIHIYKETKQAFV